jgi:hypothetical protein
VLVANPVFRVARVGQVLGRRLVLAGDTVFQGWIASLTSSVRLVEERYYTAVAVVVVIVLLYSVGR